MCKPNSLFLILIALLSTSLLPLDVEAEVRKASSFKTQSVNSRSLALSEIAYRSSQAKYGLSLIPQPNFHPVDFDYDKFHSSILYISGQTSQDSLKIQIDEAFNRQSTLIQWTLAENQVEFSKFEQGVTREKEKLVPLFARYRTSSDPIVKIAAEKAYLEALSDNEKILNEQSRCIIRMKRQVEQETSDNAKNQLYIDQVRANVKQDIEFANERIKQDREEIRRSQREFYKDQIEHLHSLY